MGCIVAALLVLFSGGELNLFREMPAEALAASSWRLGDGSIFALPAFTFPKASWAAVVAIMPIAIATIPESTAHMYQLDIYVNEDVYKRQEHGGALGHGVDIAREAEIAQRRDELRVERCV